VGILRASFRKFPCIECQPIIDVLSEIKAIEVRILQSRFTNMSLLKIPLILSSAIGVHLSLTPPNAPPTKNEVVHDNFNEWVLIQHVKYGLIASKVMV